MSRKLYKFLFFITCILSVVMLVFLIDLSFIDFIINYIFFSFINLCIVIIIHELGHLVFGKISGYEFISFRFLFLIIYKIEDQYKIKFVPFLPTLVGQCLMKYPEYDNNTPYKLFNYGGLIFSYSYSFLMLVMTLNADDDLTKLFLISGFLISMIINLSNSIVEKNMVNDLSNVNEIENNLISKKSFFYQLDVIGMLQQGKYFNDAICDIDLEELDFSIPIQIASALFMYYSKMEILKYEEGYKIISLMYDNLYKINNIYKDTILYTYLFHKIVYQKEILEAKAIIDEKKLEKEIIKFRKVNYDLNQRIYLAYKIYILNDFNNISKDFVNAKKANKKSLYEKEEYLLNSWINQIHTDYTKML